MTDVLLARGSTDRSDQSKGMNFTPLRNDVIRPRIRGRWLRMPRSDEAEGGNLFNG